MVAPYNLLRQIKYYIQLTTVEQKELKKMVFIEWDVATTSIRAYANIINATTPSWNT